MIQFLKRHWILWVLAVCAALPLRAVLFSDEVIGPWQQVSVDGVEKPLPATSPWDVLQADAVLQFYPWRKLVLESWGRGELPAWNPYQLMGTALLANSQSGALYPPHIAFGVLRIPTGHAVDWLAFLHLFWASLGVFALARRLGANEIGGLIGAVSFQLSAFMIGWAGLASVPSTVAWIPWCLRFAHDAAGDRQSFGKLGVCVGMLLLAGHLQFAAYGLMATATMIVCTAIAVKSWRGLALGAASVALGAGLAMPQVLPALEFGKLSHRQGTPTSEGYEGYIASAIKPYEWLGVSNALSFGNPRTLSQVAPLSQYWPAQIKRGGNFAESALALGPIVLIGLLCWRRQKADGLLLLGIGVVGVLAFLLAVGSPLNRMLYFWFPGWSATGSPGRVIALFVIAGCTLGGLMLGRHMESEAPEKWKRVAAAGVVALLLCAAPKWIAPSLEPWLADFPRALIAETANRAAPTAVLVTLVGVGTALVAVAIPRLSFSAVVGAAASSAWLVAIPHGQVPASPLPPQDGRVAFINPNWELVAPSPTLLPPNTPTIFGLEDVGGYDSLMDRTTVGMLHDAVGQDPAPPANGNMMLIKPSTNLEKLAELGVSGVFRAGASEMIQGALPLASTPSAPAEVSNLSASGLRVRAVEYEPLTIRYRGLPGWRVETEVGPVALQPGRWIEVSAGNRSGPEIQLSFVPPGYGTGCAIAGASGLCLAGLALSTKRKNIKKNAGEIA